MAKLLEQTTPVDASVARVWETLTDWSEAASLFAGVRRVRVSPLSTAVPSELEVERFDGGREVATIDVWQEPNQLSYTMVEGPITTRWDWSVSERVDEVDAQTGCELSLSVNVSLRGPAALFGPFYRVTVRAHNRALPAMIKERAEA